MGLSVQGLEPSKKTQKNLFIVAMISGEVQERGSMKTLKLTDVEFHVWKQNIQLLLALWDVK